MTPSAPQGKRFVFLSASERNTMGIKWVDSLIDVFGRSLVLPVLVSSSNRVYDNLFISGDLTAQLYWWSYLPSDSSIIAVSKAQFYISTGGIYYIYCHLRVGEQVKRIVVRTNSSELFSTVPKFTSSSTGVVRMSRLTKIHRNALLYVEVEFNNSFLIKMGNDIPGKMNKLFPDYNNEEQSPNSFGMFLVN